MRNNLFGPRLSAQCSQSLQVPSIKMPLLAGVDRAPLGERTSDVHGIVFGVADMQNNDSFE